MYFYLLKYGSVKQREMRDASSGLVMSLQVNFLKPSK